MSKGTIKKVAGPLVIAKGMRDANMFDVVRVSEKRLIGEIIEMHGDEASIQVYEETSGLAPGSPVESTGEPMSVELGPGLIGSIYDGIQRPLDDIMKISGNNLERGVEVPSLKRELKWEFTPQAKVGDNVVAGEDVYKRQLQSYVDKINSGDMTLSEAAEEYAADHDADSTYYKPSAAKSDNITSELVTALDSVSEGKAAVASTSNALYVIRKLSIDDAYTDEVEASDSRYISLLADMKGDEFNDYVMEQSVSVSDVELNTAAINSVSLSSMVNDSNQFGTVSETEDETDDDDSSASESSAEE